MSDKRIRTAVAKYSSIEIFVSRQSPLR